MSPLPPKAPLGAALALTAAVIGVCGSAFAAGGRLAGSVTSGRETALAVCSACHVVAERQEIAPTLQEPTPSFQAIADDPRTSAASLRLFLKTTHWDWKTLPMKMPQRNLAPGQAEAVISYILSLRRRG